MAESQKRFRVTYKSKNSLQYMTLLARDRDEAKRLAEQAQWRRHERFSLTFDRLKNTDMPKEQLKAELERRKRDQGRYDDGDLTIKSIEEAK